MSGPAFSLNGTGKSKVATGEAATMHDEGLADA